MCIRDSHRELARGGDLLDELVRGLQLLGRDVELVLGQVLQPTDLLADLAHVRRRVRDVAGAGLTLGADHRRTLGDAAQRLAEVGRTADEGHREGPLVDVCLLYTSDAADERSSVDLGGRRIIKKKNTTRPTKTLNNKL